MFGKLYFRTSEELAHICHLISYLLLNIIYVEKREALALVFAENAYNYLKSDKYGEWIEVVKKILKGHYKFIKEFLIEVLIWRLE